MSKPRVCDVSMLNPKHELSPFRAPSANKEPTDGPTYDKIRMIEYSAYQQLLEQANALAEAVHASGMNTGHEPEIDRALTRWIMFKEGIEK
jgi:hypothetical protein